MSDLELVAGDESQAEVVADIATAQRPDEPVDPVVQRYLWEERNDSEVQGLLLGLSAGQATAYVATYHRDWPADDDTRGAYLEIGIRPEAMTDARVRQLIEAGLEILEEDGAGVVEAYAREDEGWLRAALVGAGLEQDHLSRVWQLDLQEARDRLAGVAAETRAAAASLGLRLTTLAGCALPDKLTRLHELTELARRDIPRSVPALPNPKEILLKRLHAPDTRLDRYWVAEYEGQLVGLSYLRFPPVRGHVWTGFTASHPAHRGRGIARAVKMETLLQAISLGVPLVRTDNDERNLAMLHINEDLGYRSIPAWVSHLKRLPRSA